MASSSTVFGKERTSSLSASDTNNQKNHDGDDSDDTTDLPLVEALLRLPRNVTTLHNSILAGGCDVYGEGTAPSQLVDSISVSESESCTESSDDDEHDGNASMVNDPTSLYKPAVMSHNKTEKDSMTALSPSTKPANTYPPSTLMTFRNMKDLKIITIQKSQITVQGKVYLAEQVSSMTRERLEKCEQEWIEIKKQSRYRKTTLRSNKRKADLLDDDDDDNGSQLRRQLGQKF